MTNGISATKIRLIFICIVIFFFYVSPALSDQKTSNSSAQNLVLLNWSEYFDPQVLADFKKQTGITVSEVYYESDEVRNEMMVKANGKGYDLVVCNGPNISAYSRRNWLTPVSESNVPNLKHVDKRWRSAFPDSFGYAVPYLWGTLGIGYRSDKILNPVTSWMELFRPDESLKGKIVMLNDSRDLVGMALKALGHSANSSDSNELEEAKQLLLKQKPYVQNYSYISLSKKATLVTGEAHMSMIYNGDVLMLQEYQPAIKFVQPKEGGNLWCDYVVVMQSSLKKDLAFTFLNYLHEPEVMAKMAQYAYYATTNMAAEKLLPEEFLNDTIIYPPKEILENSETYSVLPPRTTKKFNSIFNLVIR